MPTGAQKYLDIIPPADIAVEYGAEFRDAFQPAEGTDITGPLHQSIEFLRSFIGKQFMRHDRKVVRLLPGKSTIQRLAQSINIHALFQLFIFTGQEFGRNVSLSSGEAQRLRNGTDL